jgi:M42 glutamyl aminopeptidase
VRNAIVAELQECAHVRMEHDAYGNMIARYQRGTRRRPRWAFAAHMDHPGWVRSKEGDWRFLGSVAERFLVNPRKREFGDFAMWDLPAFELKDGQIHSRACDDLLGCAEIICLFRELEAAKADAHCLGIFTRAEEVGFWGAIQLARSGILPKDITVFSLETSTPRGGAEIGRGPIVRVGDRLSIFNSGETARVMSAAATKRHPGTTLSAGWRRLRSERLSALRLPIGGREHRARQLSQLRSGWQYPVRIRLRGRLCEYGPALSGTCRRRNENVRSDQGSPRHAGKKGRDLQAVSPGPALSYLRRSGTMISSSRRARITRPSSITLTVI